MVTLIIRARACLRRGGGYTYDKSTRLLEKGGGGFPPAYARDAPSKPGAAIWFYSNMRGVNMNIE